MNLGCAERERSGPAIKAAPAMPAAASVHYRRGLAETSAAPLRRGRKERRVQAENEEPQPQDLVEFGLMKLNPCRISVSS